MIYNIDSKCQSFDSCLIGSTEHSKQRNLSAPFDTEKELVYIAVMAWYLTQMHQAIMGAWEAFAETTDKIAEEYALIHQIQVQRHNEFIGQESYKDYYRGHQNAAFSLSNTDHLEHLHLNTAV